MDILYLIYKKLSVGDINYSVLLINYIICAISGFTIVFSNSFFATFTPFNCESKSSTTISTSSFIVKIFIVEVE